MACFCYKNQTKPAHLISQMEMQRYCSEKELYTLQ